MGSDFKPLPRPKGDPENLRALRNRANKRLTQEEIENAQRPAVPAPAPAFGGSPAAVYGGPPAPVYGGPPPRPRRWILLRWWTLAAAAVAGIAAWFGRWRRRSEQPPTLPAAVYGGPPPPPPRPSPSSPAPEPSPTPEPSKDLPSAPAPVYGGPPSGPR